MSAQGGRLRFREKAGYALGDAGANLVFQMLIIFQAGFYTDVMGISPAALGALLLLVRFSDAFTDPLMGLIADRTRHRWGRFRPWLLWSAIPFAICYWLAFTVPPFGETGTLVYAYLTYALLMAVYTMNNVPYSALNGVMTPDGAERTRLSSYRFVAAMTAALVVQGFTLPLVDKLGGGDTALGWSRTIALYGAAAVVFFVVTFFASRERVRPAPTQTSDLRAEWRDLWRNPLWKALFWASLFIFITLALRGGGYYYYFTYFVDREALRGLIASLGLVVGEAGPPAGAGWWLLDTFGLLVRPGADPSRVGFSLFNLVGTLATLAGVGLARPLAVRFGKRAAFLAGLAGATVLQLAFAAFGRDAVGAMFLTTIVGSFAYGVTVPLLWAMIGDAADFAEWKFDRRATGLAYAGVVFALKTGLGLGGAFSGWILAAHGYSVATATTPEVLEGLRRMVSWYSVAPLLAAWACLWFYPLDCAGERRMDAELAARRAATTGLAS